MKNKIILLSLALMGAMFSHCALAIDWAKCPSTSELARATVNGVPSQLGETFWFADAGTLTSNQKTWYVGVLTIEKTQETARTQSIAGLKAANDKPLEDYSAPNDFFCTYGTTLNDHTLVVAATAPVLTILE